jgi:hypothetical protein
MRYLLLLSFFLWLGCNQQIDSAFLIEKSVEAHGGWDAWYAVEKVSYLKEYDLFYEDGTLESSFRQSHDTNIHPVYKNQITKTDGSLLAYDGNKYIKIIGDSSLQVTAADSGLIHSSIYVISPPFNLASPGAIHQYIGMDTLFNGAVVHSIKVIYDEEGKENHPWWYYFDPVSYKLVGNMVDHNGSFSLLTNDEYVEHQGVLWNKKRTGYRTDRNGKILFKRSDYTYTFQ